MMPHDLPPWHAVQQQTQRWLRANCFEHMAHDRRAGLRLEVIKHHEARRAFARLARDYERPASTPSGCHWLAFASLMLHSLFPKSP